MIKRTTNKFLKVLCVMVVLCFLSTSVISGFLKGGLETKVLAAAEGNIDNWWFGYGNLPTDGRVLHTVNEKHSGIASAKIINYTPQSDNKFLILTRSWTPVVGDEYQFTFWFKTKGLGFMAAWAIADNNLTGGYFGTSDGDWTKRTAKFTATAGDLANQRPIQFLSAAAGTIWIDDVTIDKINSDKTLTNVLTEGFETGVDLIPAGNVSGAIINSEYDTLNISWNNPIDEDFDSIVVYSVYPFDGSLTQVAVLSKTQNTLNLTGMTPNTYYQYKIKSVDATGNQSSGVDVFGKTLASLINKPALTLQGVPESMTMLKAGRITATTNVRNALDTSTLPVSIILALYNGDTMIDMSFSAANVGKTLQGQGEQLSTWIDVPDLTNENYHVHVYIWDGIMTIKPLMGRTFLDPTQMQYQ